MHQLVGIGRLCKDWLENSERHQSNLQKEFDRKWGKIWQQLTGDTLAAMSAYSVSLLISVQLVLKLQAVSQEHFTWENWHISANCFRELSVTAGIQKTDLSRVQRDDTSESDFVGISWTIQLYVTTNTQIHNNRIHGPQLWAQPYF